MITVYHIISSISYQSILHTKPYHGLIESSKDVTFEMCPQRSRYQFENIKNKLKLKEIMQYEKELNMSSEMLAYTATFYHYVFNLFFIN